MISRDVFISHASEDKDTVARPINRALNKLGVSTWFDEASMVPGDSLTAAVGEGLAEAALVLLIITPSFIGKGWPELELRNALAQQGRTGDRKIVPLIDGDFDEVAKAYPLLQDTIAARWDGDADALAREIASRFDRRPAEWHAGTHRTAYTGPVWFRVTPTAENTGAVHEITFLWGRKRFATAAPLNGPTSFTHGKDAAEEGTVQIRVYPPAIVTIGTGSAPDSDATPAGEGWVNSADASTPPLTR